MSKKNNKIPQALYESIMKVGDFEFRVYVLDDGRRIIHADDILAFFELFGIEDNDENPTKRTND